MRDFLVEVTVTFPNGEKMEDWSYLGHLYADVNEAAIDIGSVELSERVRRLIEDWVSKNPVGEERRQGGARSTVYRGDNDMA